MEADELREIIRVGKVHSVKKNDMTARVKFEDSKIMSGELHILYNSNTVTIGNADGHSHSASIVKWTPKIGDMVLCIMRPDGDGDGFIVGSVR